MIGFGVLMAAAVLSPTYGLANSSHSLGLECDQPGFVRVANLRSEAQWPAAWAAKVTVWSLDTDPAQFAPPAPLSSRSVRVLPGRAVVTIRWNDHDVVTLDLAECEPAPTTTSSTVAPTTSTVAPTTSTTTTTQTTTSVPPSTTATPSTAIAPTTTTTPSGSPAATTAPAPVVSMPDAAVRLDRAVAVRAPLPATGVEHGPALLAGAAMVAAGLLLVRAAGRRS